MTNKAILEMCKKFGQVATYHDHTHATCPFCGSQYLECESRPLVDCPYCEGQYNQALKKCEALDTLLQNWLMRTQKNQNLAQVVSEMESVCQVTDRTYYGFEIARRLRAVKTLIG